MDLEWRDWEKQLYYEMVLEVEWNGNGKGMESTILCLECFHRKALTFLPIPLRTVPSNSIPFHGIPLSTLKCRPLGA